jgi:hypothetical protein
MLAGLVLPRRVWSRNVTAISLKCWSESDQRAIREQLVRILNSGPFHQSQRRQRFLEYLVNETLAGRGERLKGYNVALAVFQRPETFDPTVDPLVRIEAARLREKLREYYGTDGQDDSFTSTYRRAHTHRKSSFGTRVLRQLLAGGRLRRKRSPPLFPR